MKWKRSPSLGLRFFRTDGAYLSLGSGEDGSPVLSGVICVSELTSVREFRLIREDSGGEIRTFFGSFLDALNRGI
ncbi:MAG: hypothetical protein AAF212_11015 [Verrucomicrobiota bacterium]